jgi:H+/Cl- antiporter ClcA
MMHDDSGTIADPQSPSSAHSPVTEPSISPIRAPILAPVVNRLQASPETIVLLLAVVVGGGGGLCVVLFRYLIDLTHELLLENLMGQMAGWGSWSLALIPLLGGAIVGLLRWQVKDFGQGLTGLRTAIAGAQDIPALRPVVKALAAVISLGSGASLGPEGPSVEIGASFGVLLGQALQVSKERQQLLLGLMRRSPGCFSRWRWRWGPALRLRR